MKITLPNQYDFFSRFSRLTTINILSNITEPLAGTISLIFLGHLNQINYLAGITLSTTLFNYMYFIVNLLRMGTTGVTAQAVGRDDREQMLLVGLRNGLIALSIGGLILVLQYPLQQLWFGILNATPLVKASGIDYFNARIWGAPAVAVNFVLVGWFLGREKSGYVLLMTLVANTANIMFDYLFIIHWHWASTGAGVSQAVSQYLMLLLGIILVSRDINWQELRSAAERLWDASAFKEAFILNGNIFIRSSASMLVATIFTVLSSAMGTTILTKNALLLQIIMLFLYFFDGVGFATETLSGNFKGKKDSERLLPIIQVALSSSLLLGLAGGGACFLFPQSIFGLFTNHEEVTEQIEIYIPWLVSILGLNSVSVVLEGYFAGLAQGQFLRNSALWGSLLGFAPLAIVAWHYHSNHILWLAMTVFRLTRTIVLVIQMPGTFEDSLAVVTSQLPSSQQETKTNTSTFH